MDNNGTDEVESRNDVLAHFRGLKSLGATKRIRRTEGKDFFFCISAEGHVSMLDTDGKVISPSECRAANIYQDRALSILSETSSDDFNINFNDNGEEGLNKTSDQNNRHNISFAPGLTHALIRSGNLVTSDLSPVELTDEAEILSLVLRPVEKDKSYVPTLVAGRSEEGYDLDSPCVTPLADGLVLSGNKIIPTQYIGENFSSLPLFMSDFPQGYLDCYLSIFYSFVENLEVEVPGYGISIYPEKAEIVKILDFVRVDPDDQSLYITLKESVGEIPPGMLRDFGLTMVATIDHDTHRIHVRQIGQVSGESFYEEFREFLESALKSKDMKRVMFMDDTVVMPSDVAGPFLLGNLPELARRFRLTGINNLKRLKVRPVTPSINITLSSGIDFLEGDVNVTVENTAFTLRDLLEQYRRNRCLTLPDGSQGVLDSHFMDRLSRVLRPRKGSEGGVKISFFDLPEIDNLLKGSLDDTEAFAKTREVFEGFNKLRDKKLKLPPVKCVLRDYQKEGVKWMRYLHDNNLGGCLADDMGLGKTLQTISLLAGIYPDVAKWNPKKLKPTLVVLPKSLIFNWQDELDKFAPFLSYSAYYGQDRDMEKVMENQIILTTYATVRNDIKILVDKEFEYVVLDESQNIKNVASLTTKAVRLLKSKHRLALSGTPMENNLTELYSLFKFLNPSMFGTLDEFNADYTYPIQKEGNGEAMSVLRRKIFPFILRRLKGDVLTELPERVERVSYVEMSPEQAKYYDERRRYYSERIKGDIARSGIENTRLELFQALMELRRIASVPGSVAHRNIPSPKIDALVEDLQTAVQNGHKAVVFFNFIAGLEEVVSKIDESGIIYSRITGETSVKSRDSIVKNFQNSKKPQVLLMTLKTGGVGLNLTSADMVYIFEPWWNKAAEDQAINRLHRIGQHNAVFACSMLTCNTIEEKIHKLQQQKAKLFEGLIGNDATMGKNLTEEDIEFLLGK